MRQYCRGILIFVLALLLSGSAHAADVDSYLPNSAEIVVSINVTQIMGSQIGKKYFAGAFEQMLKDNSQAQAVLKEVGMDPTKDLTRVTWAATTAGPDNALAIIGGKFNLEKIAEVAAKAAAEHKDKIKIHQASGQTIYETLDENHKSTFMAFASGSALLLSSSREQLSDALAKAKVGKPRKEMAALIAKGDEKQSGWLAALPILLAKVPADDPKQKAALKNVEGITGVLKVDADARLELSMLSKDAQSAAVLQKMVNDFVNLGKLFVPTDKPELGPVVDLLNSIRTAAKPTAVTITAEMTGSQIDKAVKQLPK